MASLGSVKGLALFNDLFPSNHCHGCLQGKMCRTPFSSTRTKTTHIGQVIHSDVSGPMEIATQDGERYYVIFKDGYLGWCEFSCSNRSLRYPKPSRFSHQRWKLTLTRRSRFYAQMMEGSTAVCKRKHNITDLIASSGLDFLSRTVLIQFFFYTYSLKSSFSSSQHLASFSWLQLS
jgi:hypothetical protein